MTREHFLPSFALSNAASPQGWSQNWSHGFSSAANSSGTSTSECYPGMPWAQGVAGSNPVAPTTSLGSVPDTWVTDHSDGERQDKCMSAGQDGYVGARVTLVWLQDQELTRED
jgi:hypothetical protein